MTALRRCRWRSVTVHVAALEVEVDAGPWEGSDVSTARTRPTDWRVPTGNTTDADGQEHLAEVSRISHRNLSWYFLQEHKASWWPLLSVRILEIGLAAE